MADLGGLNSGISKKINDKAQQEVAAAIGLISKAPCWRAFLAVHPAADRIPEASEEEKRTLATDLARQGQRQPVILVHVATRPNAAPELLDGRTRLDLLSAAGIDVVDDANGKILVHHRVVEVADDAAAELLSLSLNVHRRHLTAEQKRELIAQQLKATPEKSNRQIAETVKVADHKTVASVRAEKESTGEIPQLTKTVGKDGKARKQPAKKTKKPVPPEDLVAWAASSISKDEATKRGIPIELRNDIGVDSRAEVERLRVHIKELQDEKRQFEIKTESEITELKVENSALKTENAALKTENAALRAKLEAAPEVVASSKIATADTVTAGDPGPLPDCLQRKPKATGTPDSSAGVTLGDAVSNAFKELAELSCECRDVVDNASPGISETQRIQMLDETAGVLENLSEPDIPAELASIAVNLPKPRRLRSRGDRRDAALDTIDVCIKALDTIDENDPRHQQAHVLRNTLEDASTDAEECEFPGMYQ